MYRPIFRIIRVDPNQIIENAFITEQKDYNKAEIKTPTSKKSGRKKRKNPPKKDKISSYGAVNSCSKDTIFYDKKSASQCSTPISRPKRGRPPRNASIFQKVKDSPASKQSMQLKKRINSAMFDLENVIMSSAQYKPQVDTNTWVNKTNIVTPHFIKILYEEDFHKKQVDDNQQQASAVAEETTEQQPEEDEEDTSDEAFVARHVKLEMAEQELFKKLTYNHRKRGVYKKDIISRTESQASISSISPLVLPNKGKESKYSTLERKQEPIVELKDTHYNLRECIKEPARVAEQDYLYYTRKTDGRNYLRKSSQLMAATECSEDTSTLSESEEDLHLKIKLPLTEEDLPLVIQQ